MFEAFSSTYIVYLILALLIAIPVHEAVHGLVARWLGDTTAHEEGRITLNPLKHVDIVFTILVPVLMVLVGAPPIFAAKPVPFNPENVRFGDFGAAMVGVAGPLSNLLQAVLGAILFRLGLDGGAIGAFLIVYILVNISLFVFNMIPIPPLDGSRLLYAFAPESVQRVMAVMEGFGLLITFGILIVLMQFIGPVISNITESIFLFLLR